MAITNFFAHAAAIDFVGCLNITLKKEGGQLTVSVLLQNDACTDTAKAHIPPLILKGTAKELCEGFFPAIAAPVAQASDLLVNMEQFLKGQQAAKKNAAMHKKDGGKSGGDAAVQDNQLSKYDAVMAKVDALEAEGKFREAWMKVPQPFEFPDKAEKLRERRKNLSAKFSPDLFEPEQTATIEVEPKIKDDATDNTDAEGLYDEGEGQ